MKDARVGGSSFRTFTRAAATALVCIALASCAQQTVKTQVSRDLPRVETDLHRGVSTKADVLGLLGQPDGHGGAVFIKFSGQEEIWYYESSSLSLTGPGRQDILAVFFKADLFEGYLWFANAIDAHF